MPSFTKGPSLRTPFGRNEYLRSTRDLKFESYTLAASTVPAETIDGHTGQKVLQTGTVLAKITSGPEIGKVGPFQGGSGTNEVQTLTRTSTGGTVTLSFDGEGPSATVPATAAGFTAAAVTTALEGLSNINPGDVTVTGAAGGPLTVTFGGQYAYTNVAQITVDNTLATGGTVVAATTTQGASSGAGGATDGRGDTANIVGINDTFLPWQLTERDVEVAALYEGTVVQAWCIQLNAAGTRVALSDATAAAMGSGKGLQILFK